MSATDFVATYFATLRDLRAASGGAAASEASCHPALAALLDAVGAELRPRVRCVGQLQNFLGADAPDFGLYADDQFSPEHAVGDAPGPAPGQKPARGVVAVKGPGADVLGVGPSPPVAANRKRLGPPRRNQSRPSRRRCGAPTRHIPAITQK